jgi:hypothetical protein
LLKRFRQETSCFNLAIVKPQLATPPMMFFIGVWEMKKFMMSLAVAGVLFGMSAASFAQSPQYGRIAMWNHGHTFHQHHHVQR